MIRLLIVDDSKVIREVIKDLVADAGIEVVGEAENGKEAIDRTKELRPDLITMDVMMPVMDGLTAVEQIMAYHPTPILVLASSINRKDVNIAFEAIQLGALDVMEKPDNLTREGFAALRDILVQKIRLLSTIRVISHLKGRHKRLSFTPPPVVTPPPPSSHTRATGKQSSPVQKTQLGILAIGASTGGPKAVLNVLRHLPADFPLPGVLVQHIGASFTAGFADWLNKECKLKVKMAAEGDSIIPGTILVGPGDRHMEVEGNRIVLNDSAPVNNCRPSVDVLFKSVAQSFRSKAIALLLTGMGRDGADGMAEIKSSSGLTLVQDEESSVIFGMPRAAIELGVVDKVLSLKEIPGEIMKLIGGSNG